MNHTYRVVYNESTNTYVAVSENEPARGKKGKSVKTAVAAAIAMTFGGVAGTASAVINDNGRQGNSNILISPSNSQLQPALAGATGGGNAIGIGSNAKVHQYGVSIGYQTQAVSGSANHQGNVAIGPRVKATGEESVAVGTGTQPSDPNNANWVTLATGAQTVAFGTRAQAVGAQSTAVGNDVYAGGYGSIAIGSDDTGDTNNAGHQYTIATKHRYNVAGSANGGAGSVPTLSSNPDNIYVATATQGNGAVSVGAHTQSLHHGATALGAGAIAGMGKYVSGSVKNNNLRIDSVTGIQATAVGSQSFAASDRTTAVGANAMAGGENATALGSNAVAFSNQTLAIGDRARAGSNGTLDTALLNPAQMSRGGDRAIAIGTDANALNTESIAFGTNASSEGFQSIAIGSNAQNPRWQKSTKNENELVEKTVKGNHTIAIGANALTDRNGSIALGYNANASSASSHLNRGNPANPLTNPANLDPDKNTRIAGGPSPSIAIGQNSTADGGSVTLGDRSFAQSLGVALGPMATAGNVKNNLTASSVAIGAAAYAGGNSGLAVGRQAAAVQSFDQAIGMTAIANGTAALAIGHSANASGYRAIAIGSPDVANASSTTGTAGEQKGTNHQPHDQTLASAKDAIAFGGGARALANSSLSIGPFSTTSKDDAVAIGYRAYSSGKKAVSIGSTANTTADTSVAIGANTLTTAVDAIAAGTNTTVSGARSIAVGAENKITGKDSAAIGLNNTVGANNAFVLGNNINTQITGRPANLLEEIVILGHNSSAAVASTEKNATVNGIKYDGFAGWNDLKNGSVVSVGSADRARQIKYVAPGKISEDSTDAINGSQLYLTQKALGNVGTTTANHLGGGSRLNQDGTLTPPSYNLVDASNPANNQVANNVGAALSNLNTYVNNGWLVQNGTGVTKGKVTPGERVRFVGSGDTTVDVAQETTDGLTVVTISSRSSAAPETTKLTVNQQGNEAGKVQNPAVGDENKLVNATTIAKAVNESGWNVVADKEEGGEVSGAEKQLINPGETVKLQAGKNMQVKQDGNNFTYSTLDEVNFTKVNSDSVVIGGVTNTDAKPVTLTVSDGSLKVGDKDGAPVNITNVKEGKLSPDSKDAVNGSQLYAAGNSLSNIIGGDTAYNPDTGEVGNFNFNVKKDNGSTYGEPATTVTKGLENLNQYVNEGWNISGETNANGNKVTPGDKVKFVGEGAEVVVSDESQEGVTTVTIKVPESAGTPTTGLTVADGKVTTPDTEEGKKFVNATTVADVVNKASWSLSANGEKKDDINAGDGVNFANGTGTSVSVTQNEDGKGSTIKVDVNVSELSSPLEFKPAENGGNATVTTAEPNKLATAGDVANVSNNTITNLTGKGLNFGANKGDTIHKNLGDTLMVEGGYQGEESAVSDKNTYVESKDGKLTIKFADTPEFKGTKLSDGGNTINLSPAENNTLKLGGGDTNAPVTISNVAEGTKDSDAVNVAQLNKQKWLLNVGNDGGTSEIKGDQAAAEIKNNSEVNFIAGKGIHAVRDGANITLSASAEPAEVKFADMKAGADGKVETPAEGNIVVNATTIAKAVNESGWNVV
ncbi:MAG: ESPR-type extended signal peptide-containing protein, partial [Conchiformibius sp.]|nr:ESPR-type extended signal peptide-containing protein [Conchiformibius sp.]